MSNRRNLVLGVLVRVMALGSFVACVAGCAGLGASETEESQPLPATIVDTRAAIEAERARLMELISQPPDDSHPSGIDTDALVTIAERLSQLQAALEELELEGDSQSTAP
jgi:hypothetical protein